MRRLLFLPVIAVFCLVLVACEDQPTVTPYEVGSGSAEAEGFYYQSHWSVYLARHTADSPFTPERSDWERVEALERSEGLAPEDLCGEPLGVVQAWAQARNLVGPPQDEHLAVDMRVRDREDGRVEGLLQRWGFRDDAVAGVDHRLLLRPNDDADGGHCLVIERVEARHYCRRGIERGARCL